MGKILLDVKLLYDEMGNAEKKIADFLLKSPTAILPISIVEFAEKCGVGEATIVRFSRRLGLSGYQQLKISIAQEQQIHSIGENISPDDSAYDIFSKVCDDVYSSFEKTKKALNGEVLQACCEKILAARDIYTFGLGNSSPVAQDAAHKFLRLGLKAHVYTDNHMQAIAAAHVSKEDVVIGFSHSGSSKDIVQNLQVAKQNGATTISITNIGKSPIDKVSDYILHTNSDETNYSILGLSSRIVHLAIIDTIYFYLVCRKSDSSEQIAKTEEALLTKKY